jgi:hypothetical protein
MNGGVGWRYLENKTESIDIAKQDTYTYKNKYKVVARVENSVTLSAEFNVYNKKYSQTIFTIEPSIGPNFNFANGENLVLSIKEGNTADNKFSDYILKNLNIDKNEKISSLFYTVTENNNSITKIKLPTHVFK